MSQRRRLEYKGGERARSVRSESQAGSRPPRRIEGPSGDGLGRGMGSRRSSRMSSRRRGEDEGYDSDSGGEYYEPEREKRGVSRGR